MTPHHAETADPLAGLDGELRPQAATLPALDLSDIPAARARMAAMTADMTASLGMAAPSGVAVHDDVVPVGSGAAGVPVRVYVPESRSAPAAILDVHGGGFVLGDLDTDHPRNLMLAKRLGVVVVSVGYRLAPEHPFPAGLDDCMAVLTWVVEHADALGVDVGRIAVHGISAGGGLCAALTLVARDRGGPARIAFAYLGTPELDDRLDSPSMRAFTDTPMWNRAAAEASWDAYLGPGRRGGSDVPAYAAPARATDLTGLPPTYVSVMQFDPLRDEGIGYATALLAAGVSAELHLYPGTFHGSNVVFRAQVSRRETAEAVAVLRHGLGLPAS